MVRRPPRSTRTDTLSLNDALPIFARNLLNFLTPMIDKESKTLKIDTEDETVSGTMVTRDGAIVHAAVKEAVSKAVAGGAEASASEMAGTAAGDRKSTRLTPDTNAHLVCRLLLEKKKQKECIREH